MAHTDLSDVHEVHEVRELRGAVAPLIRNVRSRVADASDRTLGYVREAPVRSALAAAAVGTLVYALVQMLSSRGSR